MRRISKILRVQNKVSATGEKYKLTVAQMDDGEIYEGYGDDYEVGESVETFYHERYNRLKFRKYKSKRS